MKTISANLAPHCLAQALGLLFVGLLAAQSVLAQSAASGVITGGVFNSNTGEYGRSAEVRIEETEQTTTIDPADRFSPARAHGSTASCLYGNISYRVGRKARFAEAQEALQHHEPALEALDRIKEHLAAHSVNLEQQPLALGPWLEIDPASDNIASVGSGDASTLDSARYLLRETQRPPYVIPENV